MVRILSKIFDFRRIRSGGTATFSTMTLVIALYGTECLVGPPPWHNIHYPTSGYKASTMELRATGDSLEVKVFGHGGVINGDGDYELRLTLDVKAHHGLSDIVLYPDSVNVLFEDQPMTLDSDTATPPLPIFGRQMQITLDFVRRDPQLQEVTIADSTDWGESVHLAIVLDGFVYRKDKRVDLGTVQARDFLWVEDWKRLTREKLRPAGGPREQ